MSQTISCLTECLRQKASRPRAPPYDHQAEHGSDADGRKSEKGEHTIGSGRLVDDACDKGEQRLRSIHGGAHQSYGLAGVLPPIFNCCRAEIGRAETGRAACRERVWQYVLVSVVGGTLKKK